MEKRSREELTELARAIAIRRIEMAEAKARNEMVEMPVPKASAANVSYLEWFFYYTRAWPSYLTDPLRPRLANSGPVGAERSSYSQQNQPSTTRVWPSDLMISS